eukprot:TRINITY_DN12557_c0_g1_i1.p1 TRINITY_DN12557_c0_g1~~TRINITY_DN12557_c0_g1_i1.p1  ORF type:complete len:278 (+),score=50.01 TRINITY_DN12557_c0_g1_i1:19-852(+)
MWFESLGLFVFLSIWGLASLKVSQIKFSLGFYFIFLISNYVIFQPWDKDNTKLFYLWVFVAAAVIANLLKDFVFLNYRQNAASPSPSLPHSLANGSSKNEDVTGKIHKIKRREPTDHGDLLFSRMMICAILVVLLTFTGILGTMREVKPDYWEITNQDDHNVAEFFKEKTDPITTVVVTSDKHQQPCSSLAGRTKLLGYSAWCQSHGYANTGQRHSDRMTLLRGQNAQHIIRQYNITHVLIDQRARSEGDMNFWNGHSDLRVYDTPAYQVYDVRKLL